MKEEGGTVCTNCLRKLCSYLGVFFCGGGGVGRLPFKYFRITREGCHRRFQKTLCTEGGDKVQGSVDPRFPAGLPFPVPEFLELVAFRDSGKIFQQFSRDFPGSFLGNWVHA